MVEPAKHCLAPNFSKGSHRAFWYGGFATRAKRLPAYFEAVEKAPGMTPLAKDFFVAEVAGPLGGRAY